MHRYIYYIIGAREKGTKGGISPGAIGGRCRRPEQAQRIAGYFICSGRYNKRLRLFFFFAQMAGRAALLVCAAACVQTRRGAALYFRRQRRKYTVAFLSVCRLCFGGRRGGLFVSGSGLSNVCIALPRRCCFPSGSLRACCPVTISHRGQAGADHCRTLQAIAVRCGLIAGGGAAAARIAHTRIIYTLKDVCYNI